MRVKVEFCKTKLSQIRGLMFSKKKTLIFEFEKETKISLHMFFVFFPISVYFLNSDKKIIEIKKRFLPFTFYFPKNKFRYIIESPDNLKLNIGEKINF